MEAMSSWLSRDRRGVEECCELDRSDISVMVVSLCLLILGRVCEINLIMREPATQSRR